jgi:molybdate transport system regulatory protein
MSYRRAWLLVDAMNRCFDERVVETRAGGGRQAGACLSPTGERVLADYLELVAAVDQAAAGPAYRRIAETIREEPLAPAAS